MTCLKIPGVWILLGRAMRWRGFINRAIAKAQGIGGPLKVTLETWQKLPQRWDWTFSENPTGSDPGLTLV
jgi:hypothetical protein